MPPSYELSPSDTYPENYRCCLEDSPASMPNDESLEIRTWVSTLTESEPLRIVSSDGWAAVILWEGEAEVWQDDKPDEPKQIDSCQSSKIHVDWVTLVPGDEMRTDSEATVIVVSLATPDGAPQFDRNIREGITQLLESDRKNEPLVPLLRTIRTIGNRGSWQVRWPRGGVAVTTASAPAVGPDDLTRADRSDLIFRGLPKDTPIFWTPGSDDDALAIVIDFQVESDPDPDAEPSPVSPETDGGGEGGCGWRCKG